MNIYNYMGICASDENKKKYYEKELICRSFDDLEVFSFQNMSTKCKVVDVYDGDTVTIVFYYKSEPIKVKFRLHGIDTPEIKPRKDDACYFVHKQAGAIVRDKLAEKILGKLFWVEFMERDKYGREMGILYEIDENDPTVNKKSVSVNQWIIDKQYGKEYYGGKKTAFDYDELAKIIKQ